MRSLHFIILFIILSVPLFSQTTYDDLIFDADSTTASYKPAGKSYAFIRSKKGTGGVAKTSTADSILTKAIPVTEIVLVFSETDPSAIAEREESNRQRWENLLTTYPDLFQFSTTYKNVCQCKTNGDAEAYKKVQGFYVYFGAEEPKPEEKKPVAKVEEKKVEKEKPVKEKKEKVEKESSEKEVAKVEEKKEKSVKEPKKKKEEVAETKKEEKEMVVATEPVKQPIVKREGYSKPKKAKDNKACRPPCYENGDEDLNNFFKENITLTKKQRSSDLVSVARLQLNFDGSIKKTIITGTDEVINKLVEGAINNMNLWYPMVRAGVTVKCEVKITLKYDKKTKGLKPSEIMITPRPAPKCITCMTDAEIGIE